MATSDPDLGSLLRSLYPKSPRFTVKASLQPNLTDRQNTVQFNIANVEAMALTATPATVVIGDPGAGKTTLLAVLLQRLLHSKYVPIVAQLRLIERGGSLFELAARSLARDLRPLGEFEALRIGASRLAHLLAEQAPSQKFIFLLDGLNEVSNQLLPQAIAAIETMFDEYGWNRCVITNRVTHIYRLSRLNLSGASFVFHRGITDDSARAHISARETLSDAAKARLLSVLDRGGLGADLLRNPQKLELACGDNALKDRRSVSTAGLFHVAVQHDLNKDPGEDGVPADVHVEALSALAAEMTSRSIADADPSGTNPDTAIALNTLLTAAPSDGALRRWLATHRRHASVLSLLKRLDSAFITLDEGLISFVHESYQAFFAALWLTRQLNLVADEDVTRLVRSSAWQEALSFAITLPLSDRDFEKLGRCFARIEDGVFLLARAFPQIDGDRQNDLRGALTERLSEIAASGEVVELRIDALQHLGDLMDDEAFSAVLLKSFNDPNWLVREAALMDVYTGLSARRLPEAALRNLFDDAHPWVRMAATWAAAETRVTGLSSDIQRHAEQDPDDVVREWASFNFKRLHRGTGQSRPWFEEYMQEELFADCQGATPQEFFTSGLGSSTRIVRSCSVEVLSDLGYLPAFRGMRVLQSDDSPYVRAWLMRSIGERQVVACSDVISDGIQDPDALVRFWAFESAGTLRLPLDVSTVRDIIARETSPDVVRAAAWALDGVGSKEALAALEESIATGAITWTPEVSAYVEHLRDRLLFSSPFGVAELANWGGSHSGREITSVTPSFIVNRYAEIAELADTLGQFQRIDGVIIRVPHVIRWLEQFEAPDSMRYGLKLLHAIDFYGRHRIAETFRTYLERSLTSQERARTTLCVLGNPSDSASLVSYLLRDVLGDFGLGVSDLRSVATRTPRPDKPIVLFVDDNIGSGKQSAEIFHQWCRSDKTILRERHVEPLSTEELNHVRQCDLRVFVCVATSQGCDLVRSEMASLGLTVGGVSGFAMLDAEIGCFHPTSRTFASDDERQKARGVMAEIGFSLLSDRNWPEARRRQYALGYGGAEKLLVFFYNVPTTTLPVLWKVGDYRGRQWFPLFPRRSRS